MKKIFFTKEERLFIWKNAYRIIKEQRDGEYICMALRHVIFMFFVTPENFEVFYGLSLDEMVRIYFPEMEKRRSMATTPTEKRRSYGWFGCISPETKKVRLDFVNEIIKELE